MKTEIKKREELESTATSKTWTRTLDRHPRTWTRTLDPEKHGKQLDMEK